MRLLTDHEPMLRRQFSAGGVRLRIAGLCINVWIDVPTANMRLDDCLEPAFGIYAVRASIVEDERVVARHKGVASFGIRPMFETPTPLLETFLFDFDGDLYGKHLSVELIAYLRPEMNLPDLGALKAQIAKDAEDARVALKRAG